MSKEYWKESMAAVLDDAGIVFTGEQLEKIASGAQDIAYMESEATGAIYIPHPLEAEVQNLQQKVKRVEKATEQQREDFIKNICMRRHCEPHQVHLEGDGEATIYK
jgi:hypothetical protein